MKLLTDFSEAFSVLSNSHKVMVCKSASTFISVKHYSYRMFFSVWLQQKKEAFVASTTELCITSLLMDGTIVVEPLPILSCTRQYVQLVFLSIQRCEKLFLCILFLKETVTVLSATIVNPISEFGMECIYQSLCFQPVGTNDFLT